MNDSNSVAPGRSVARMLAVLVLVGTAFVAGRGRADPGDFQAMPGLWKIVTRMLDHGKQGEPQVAWHCVDESPDPWKEFAQMPVPGHAQCERTEQRRSSTALSWTLQCAGSAEAVRGRVKFDSAEHYTASIEVAGKASVQVEGTRYAACTSPKD